MGHVSTLAMIDKLGEGFNTDVLQWKSNVEESCRKVLIAESVCEILKSNDNASEHDVATSVKEKVGDGVYSEDIMSAVQYDMNEQSGRGETIKEEISSTLLKKYTLQRAPGFQITGDNVDLAIKAKHMSIYKQNRSIHWFNLNAVKNRVNGNHLSDITTESILDVENVRFLPLHKDNEDLLHDFIPLFARCIVFNIPALSNVFSTSVVKHIPHMYTDEMSEKSEQVYSIQTIVIHMPY